MEKPIISTSDYFVGTLVTTLVTLLVVFAASTFLSVELNLHDKIVFNASALLAANISVVVFLYLAKKRVGLKS